MRLSIRACVYACMHVGACTCLTVSFHSPSSCVQKEKEHWIHGVIRSFVKEYLCSQMILFMCVWMIGVYSFSIVCACLRVLACVRDRQASGGIFYVQGHLQSRFPLQNDFRHAVQLLLHQTRHHHHLLARKRCVQNLGVTKAYATSHARTPTVQLPKFQPVVTGVTCESLADRDASHVNNPETHQVIRMRA